MDNFHRSAQRYNLRNPALCENNRLSKFIATSTFSPYCIKCFSTLSTVSSLKSHLFKALLSTSSGTKFSSFQSKLSHSSFSSSLSSSYLIPSLELQGNGNGSALTSRLLLHLQSRRSVGTPRSRPKSEYVSRSISSRGVAVNPTSRLSKYSKMPRIFVN